MNVDFEDVMFFAGLGLTAIGLWIWSPAISLTVSGVIFMVLSYLKANPGGGKE